MEGVPEDGYTTNVPLLVDDNGENEDKLCENEAEGNTSFFKTCFNGFNALSGFVPMLSLMYDYISGTYRSLGFEVMITGLIVKNYPKIPYQHQQPHLVLPIAHILVDPIGDNIITIRSCFDLYFDVMVICTLSFTGSNKIRDHVHIVIYINCGRSIVEKIEINFFFLNYKNSCQNQQLSTIVIN
ncbi:hypothetical protein HYC85_003032 [Camellia sinensis]|uniref:Uncharacterized protein n=1 Tax=Camellia sinensis TaxID=4442 RepID=A0A7J7IA07_CAMSI|nr:hypothetical protein HYC85_003032 [Camellia sinensis]